MLDSLAIRNVFGLSIKWDGEVVRILDGEKTIEEHKCRKAHKALKIMNRLQGRMMFDAYRMAK
jgi:hypothetical protein